MRLHMMEKKEKSDVCAVSSIVCLCMWQNPKSTTNETNPRSFKSNTNQLIKNGVISQPNQLYGKAQAIKQAIKINATLRHKKFGN